MVNAMSQVTCDKRCCDCCCCIRKNRFAWQIRNADLNDHLFVWNVAESVDWIEEITSRFVVIQDLEFRSYVWFVAMNMKIWSKLEWIKSMLNRRTPQIDTVGMHSIQFVHFTRNSKVPFECTLQIEFVDESKTFTSSASWEVIGKHLKIICQCEQTAGGLARSMVSPVHE